MAEVAVVGEVEATASSSTEHIDKNGTAGAWTPGTISYTSYPKLKVGNVEVIHQATCKFSYLGKLKGDPATPVKDDEEVTLTAGTTVLQGGAQSVLLDGDTAIGAAHGNKLQVKAGGKLSSQ